jgi:sulfite reductase beta subunit-like hemoprotein
MDAAMLPEIAQSAIDAYLRGLRDGGWTGSADAVRTTIAACGAAKYCWFAPAVVGRAARDRIGQSSYGQDTSAAGAARRVTGLVTLIADWAEAGRG